MPVAAARPRISRRFVALALLLAALHLVIGLSIARIEPDIYHDGLVYKSALDVSVGAVPFRDSFNAYGILYQYVQGWTLRLCGPYLLALKIELALIYAGMTLLLCFTWVRFMPEGLALFSCVLWIFTAPHSWEFWPCATAYALPFVLLSTLAMMEFVRTGSRLFAFLAGLGGGCAWAFKPSTGALQLCALAVFPLFVLFDDWRRRPRKDAPAWRSRGLDMAAVCLGCIVVIAPALLWLGWNGALHDWRRQTITFPLEYHVKFLLGKSVLRAWYENGVQLSVIRLGTKWFWPVWGVAVILWGIRGIRENNRVLALFAMVCFACWFNVLPYACDAHQWWALTPAFCLFPLLVWDFVRIERPAYRFVVTAGVLVFILGSFIYGHCVEGWSRLSTCTHPARPPHPGPNYPPALLGILDTGQRAKAYMELGQVISDHLDKHPGRRLVVIGETGAMFLPPGMDCHPVFVEWAVLNTQVYRRYHDQKCAWIKSHLPLIFTTTGQMERHKTWFGCGLKELDGYRTLVKVPLVSPAGGADYVVLAPNDEDAPR
jgi:hypothetical protein